MNPYKFESQENKRYDCKKSDILLQISLYTVFFCIISIFIIEICKTLRIFTTIEIPIDGRISIILIGLCLVSLFFGLGSSIWKN